MSIQTLEPKPARDTSQAHESLRAVEPRATEEGARVPRRTETVPERLEQYRVHDPDARIHIPDGGQCVQGGAADVKRATLAREENPPTLVAVKMLRMAGQLDRRRLRDFVNELQITAKLNHSNIVQLVGFVEDSQAGVAWLLFRWEANGNIRDFLRSGTWDLPERVSLIQDVAAGLVYLHGQEPPICHGDLKSLNILVGSEYQAIIADLGSARVKETTPRKHLKIRELQRERQSSVSHTGTNVLSTNSQGSLTGPGWTWRWAAPEVMKGTKDPDLASDIWSLGWVCWEVITDSYPFPDVRGLGGIVLNIIDGNLPAVGQHTMLAQILPLDSLRRDCLRPNSAQRPTAVEVLETLKWIPSTRPSPGQAGAPKVRSAELLWQLGRLLFFRSQDCNAMACLESSLNTALSKGHIPLQASCLLHRGDAARQHSHYEEAQGFYDKALALYEELDSDIGKAYVKLAVGDLRRMQGNLDEAEKYLRDARREGNQLEYPPLEADALFGLGATYRLRQPPMTDDARKCFEQAFDLYEQMGDERGKANSSDGLGLVAGAEGKFGEAMSRFNKELKIALRMGCSLTRAHALRGLGLVHANRGRLGRARERFEEAAKLYNDLDQGACEATVLGFLNAARQGETMRGMRSIEPPVI